MTWEYDVGRGPECEGRPSIDEAFPFPSYREYQREALQEASNALWRQGYGTVFLQLPPGIGKSGINVALGRQAESAFYTTPSKKLRRQLEDDDILNRHYSTLRARADYQCRESGENCEGCPINQDPEESCREHAYTNGGMPWCRYWAAKETAMDDRIATCTFAALITDGRIPTRTLVKEDGPITSTRKEVQISFSDRELLIIDEAHTLVDHVAGLWAGFTISPTGSLPADLYTDNLPVDALRNGATRGGQDIWLYEQLADPLDDLQEAAAEHMEFVKTIIPTPEDIQNEPDDVRAAEAEEERKKMLKEISACRRVKEGIERAQEATADGRPWVVDLHPTRDDDNELYASINVRPVDVDVYLQEWIWPRAEKRLLSTATFPYPNNPKKWAGELGLDPDDIYVVEYPMPFPTEARPIVTRTAIDRMSSGGFAANVDRIADAIRSLAAKHDGEKGLVHTVSYDRAEQLHDRLGDIAILHDRQERRRDQNVNDQTFVTRWQQDNPNDVDDDQYIGKDVLLSPSLMEGIDLPDDMCRWQVLAKLPNPHLGDSRIRYRARKRQEWEWYRNQAAMKTVQAAGRGVRHRDDHCVFYVLDTCFSDVYPRHTPDWFDGAVR